MSKICRTFATEIKLDSYETWRCSINFAGGNTP